MKEEMVRKSKGFFGFAKVHTHTPSCVACACVCVSLCIVPVCCGPYVYRCVCVLPQDKSEADVERIKATVLLCYGYVTFHSPPK